MCIPPTKLVSLSFKENFNVTQQPHNLQRNIRGVGFCSLLFLMFGTSKKSREVFGFVVCFFPLPPPTQQS